VRTSVRSEAISALFARISALLLRIASRISMRMFVVMSVFRWRYFRSVARRRAQRREDGGSTP